MAIKPSGVEYDQLSPEDMVLVDIRTGKKVEGKWNPSSDTDTHCELYRSFENIGGVVHTHSRWGHHLQPDGPGRACFGHHPRGTTSTGKSPAPRKMTPEEIAGEYELETGKVIVETFQGKSPDDIPAVLVHSHGPFAWGTDAMNAVHNAVVLEEVSFMAWHSLLLEPALPAMQQELLDKHYLRKHGANAYYGQGNVK